MPLDESIWFHRQIAYSLLFFTIGAYEPRRARADVASPHDSPLRSVADCVALL